jgi:hypothetical protein
MKHMRALIRELDWQALFVGFVTGYSVPVLLACAIPVPVWLLWFWILAPVGAGYVAAKLARGLPLYHGAATSAIGILVFGLISSSRSLAEWVVWNIATLACGVFGAWLWRRYNSGAAARRR